MGKETGNIIDSFTNKFGKKMLQLHIIKKIQQIEKEKANKKLIADNNEVINVLNGFHLYLMPVLKEKDEKEVKISTETKIFLYSKNKRFFYYISNDKKEIEMINLENETDKLGIKIDKKNFNKKSDELQKCNNTEICQVVFDILVKRGHAGTKGVKLRNTLIECYTKKSMQNKLDEKFKFEMEANKNREEKKSEAEEAPANTDSASQSERNRKIKIPQALLNDINQKFCKNQDKITVENTAFQRESIFNGNNGAEKISLTSCNEIKNDVASGTGKKNTFKIDGEEKNEAKKSIPSKRQQLFNEFKKEVEKREKEKKGGLSYK